MTRTTRSPWAVRLAGLSHVEWLDSVTLGGRVEQHT